MGSAWLARHLDRYKGNFTVPFGRHSVSFKELVRGISQVWFGQRELICHTVYFHDFSSSTCILHQWLVLCKRHSASWAPTGSWGSMPFAYFCPGFSVVFVWFLCPLILVQLSWMRAQSYTKSKADFPYFYVQLFSLKASRHSVSHLFSWKSSSCIPHKLFYIEIYLLMYLSMLTQMFSHGMK